jgi:hypothetical protein
MNAPFKHPLSTEQLERTLRLMAESRVRSWRIYPDMGMADCVDPLQDFAVRTGLVKAIGQDAVQAILDEIFRPVRAAGLLDAAEPAYELEEITAAQNRPYHTPQSTIDAFWYVVRLKDEARLKRWLDDHPYDREFLLGELEKRQ